MSRTKPFPKDTSSGDWRIVTKLSAAEAQLNTAIYLHFTSDDFVSVHTLCMAASEIINSQLLSKGQPSLFGTDLVVAEDRDSLLATMKEAANFFKHSKRDHEESLRFKPQINDLQLAMACSGFVRLTERTTWPICVLLLWVAYQYPRTSLLRPIEEGLAEIRKLGANIDKKTYYRMMTERKVG